MHQSRAQSRASSVGRLTFIAAVLCPVAVALAADDDPPGLRAGAATSNITPWLGVSMTGAMQDRRAEHVHDELYARCLVLDDGKTRLALVVCDICMIPRTVYDEAKRMVHEATGLPTAHMMMSATHTHSAPTATPSFQCEPDPDYLKFLTRRIADGVRRAVNNLPPARVGWGVGHQPNEVFNRRWYMEEGTIPPDPFGNRTDKVKTNPPRASKNLIKPAGPIDPAVPIVSVQTRDGRPIALLANYSLHYVGGTGPRHVSADYFGMFADMIQERIGADRLDPPFVGMLTNGHSGDINNVDSREKSERKPAYVQMRHVADAVASEAHRVYQSIRYRDDITLAMREARLRLGVRRPTPAEVKRAKETMARAKGPVMHTVPEVYARETVQLADYPETVEIILQAIRIGDLAIVAVPCQVFAETGLEIREKSPFDPTFTIQLVNGRGTYLPPPAQHKLGGYETWRSKSSFLEVDACPRVVDTLLKLLADLK